VAITLWDHIDAAMNGELEATLRKWHTDEGIGTPTMARRLEALGHQVDQRTVWRWIKQKNIVKGDKKR
jgi:hypothetical protein